MGFSLAEFEVKANNMQKDYGTVIIKLLVTDKWTGTESVDLGGVIDIRTCLWKVICDVQDPKHYVLKCIISFS